MNVLAFANSWRTQSFCPEVKYNPRHPCDVNPERKYWASFACSIMKIPAFQACHSMVCYETGYGGIAISE